MAIRLFDLRRRRARATAAECGNAPVFRADLEKVAEIERLFSDVTQHFGKLDGLVNNAARYTQRDPLEITESDWDFIHSVNLKATFFCCQQNAATDYSRKRRADREHRLRRAESARGRITRTIAHQGRRGHLTRTLLAQAWAPKIVNSVAPKVIPFGEPDERVKHLIAKTPAGRAGTADEIADGVVFFPHSVGLRDGAGAGGGRRAQPKII